MTRENNAADEAVREEQEMERLRGEVLAMLVTGTKDAGKAELLSSVKTEAMLRDSAVVQAMGKEAFIALFAALAPDKRYHAMRAFLALSDAQRAAIVQQRGGPVYPPVCDGGEQRFKSMDALRLKFDLCRATYTPAQQREIETLFGHNAAGRGKAERKLEYLLNICPTAPNRKAVSRAALVAALDRRLYKMDGVKEKIATCLVASRHTDRRGLRILLVGSPGTGKTTVARAIAEAYGIPFAVINLSGVSSAIDLKGLHSSYGNADAGKLVRTFAALGTSEAVIVLDELDKLGTDTKDGRAADAMLDTLSDEHLCYDAFLETEIDTRNTVYIATANTTRTIPDHLLNRFDVIHMDDYDDGDKLELARRQLIPRVIEQYGIGADELEFTQQALERLVRDHCSDRGARLLKEGITALVRHVLNLWDADGQRRPTRVDADMVTAALGQYPDGDDPGLRFHRNRARFSPAVREEIRLTLDTLRDGGGDEHRQATDRRRVAYLTALLPSDEGFAGFDAARFCETVDSTHFGMTAVKQTLAKRFFAKSLQGARLSGERILLAGGAGIGKSSICESIAAALGIPCVKISLGGVTDESTLKGFEPTYVGANAGAIVRGLARVQTTRALVQLDEIDKLGGKNGDAAAHALIDLLDDCAAFTDRFLGVAIDLSAVLFVATANDPAAVHPLLRDRFEVVRLEGYSGADKGQILARYLLPRLGRAYAGAGITLAMTEAASDLLVRDYCPSFGVRDLEQAARRLVTDKLYAAGGAAGHMVLDTDDVVRSLGAPPPPRGNLPAQAVPGFAKALAVTGDNSGMAFSIETAILPDACALCVTGLPKESAVDSVKLAKTYLRLRHAPDGADFGVHLHFGEGAVVKDGPSAGVAILVSMLSALCGTAVAGNAAYTGEIDLFGNVFAVGGVMAKIQAAERAGCATVFIPRDNYAALSDGDLDGIRVAVVPVGHVSEVLAAVLPGCAA